MLTLRKTCIERAEKYYPTKQNLLNFQLSPSIETNKSLNDQVFKLRKSILTNLFTFLPIGRLSPSMCFLFHLCLPDELSPLPIPSVFNIITTNEKNMDASSMNHSTLIETKKKGWIPTIYNLLPRKSVSNKKLSDLPASFSASLMPNISPVKDQSSLRASCIF